jgi:hypothetical protein
MISFIPLTFSETVTAQKHGAHTVLSTFMTYVHAKLHNPTCSGSLHIAIQLKATIHFVKQIIKISTKSYILLKRESKLKDN